MGPRLLLGSLEGRQRTVADRDMHKQLKPKLDQAVEEVIKKGNYDLVFERGAVVDVKPQFAITRPAI